MVLSCIFCGFIQWIGKNFCLKAKNFFASIRRVDIISHAKACGKNLLDRLAGEKVFGLYMGYYFSKINVETTKKVA